MKKIFLTFGTAILLCSNFAFAKEAFKTISINDVDSLVQKKAKDVFIYDVNVESTRKNIGIVPGAKLIDSSSQYNVATTLPANKSSELIFYCANPMCTASHQAANRAIDAGYKNVYVMVDGIYGWKKAGKTLEPVKRDPQTTNGSEISPQEVNSLVKNKKAVIVDVREAEERHEIINGSLWFPISKINNSKDWEQFKKSLPQGKTVIFHCAAGFRAKRAATKFAAEGNPTNYFKGVDQWKSEGLPVVKGPAN